MQMNNSLSPKSINLVIFWVAVRIFKCSTWLSPAQFKCSTWSFFRVQIFTPSLSWLSLSVLSSLEPCAVFHPFFSFFVIFFIRKLLMIISVMFNKNYFVFFPKRRWSNSHILIFSRVLFSHHYLYLVVSMNISLSYLVVSINIFLSKSNLFYSHIWTGHFWRWSRFSIWERVVAAKNALSSEGLDWLLLLLLLDCYCHWIVIVIWLLLLLLSPIWERTVPVGLNSAACHVPIWLSTSVWPGEPADNI